MSNSLDFCKARASNPSVSSYADRNWNNAAENMETENFFDNILQGNRKLRVDGIDHNGNKVYLNVELSFNPDADFDYFSGDSCVHDGTLLFIYEMMNKCVEKVKYAQTLSKANGQPKSGDTIKYVVGNFVVLNEFGKQFALEDKPWLQERTTVLLPLKVEIN